MKRISSTCLFFAAALLFFDVAAVCEENAHPDPSAEKEEAPGFLARLLSWLGWGKNAPIITRGDRESQKKFFGNIGTLDIASKKVRMLTTNQRLRSPLPDATGERLFALTEDKLRVQTLTALAEGRGVDLDIDENSITRLLLFRDKVIYALRDDNSIIRIDPEKGLTSTMKSALAPLEVTELMVQTRTCGQFTVSQREDQGPPTRVDLMLREGRLSRNLTRQRKYRINADPIFSKDCRTVFFISAKRP